RRGHAYLVRGCRLAATRAARHPRAATRRPVTAPRASGTTAHVTRVFLLSPAHCDGLRARRLLDDGARSDLAQRLRSADGVPLGGRVGHRGQVVLLGSIASTKYTDVLRTALGRRLFFPADFVGRGDKSRGGLLLRCVAEGRELDYVPVDGAVRHGPRPPRLAPLAR